MEKMKILRAITVTSIMGAIGFILMVLEFPIPIMPSFVKFDVSELPALITAFTFGPLYGVIVCLIKNLLHLFITTSAGVGEASNFILGAIMVFIAGAIYKKNRTYKGAVIATVCGVLAMAILSVFSNYYIVYPAFEKIYGMPMSAIIGAYTAILPSVNTLWKALIIFNLPFNLFKGLIDALICFLAYNKLKPILRGR